MKNASRFFCCLMKKREILFLSEGLSDILKHKIFGGWCGGWCIGGRIREVAHSLQDFNLLQFTSFFLLRPKTDSLQFLGVYSRVRQNWQNSFIIKPKFGCFSTRVRSYLHCSLFFSVALQSDWDIEFDPEVDFLVQDHELEPVCDQFLCIVCVNMCSDIL